MRVAHTQDCTAQTANVEASVIYRTLSFEGNVADAQRAAIDPESNEQAELFNPRTQNWQDHFRWDRDLAVGLTPTGRATIAALKMNRPLIVAIRGEERIRGRHPHV